MYVGIDQQPTSIERRGFRSLWFATTSSGMADGLAVSAGPLLVASLTSNPLLVAGLAFVQNAAAFLFSMPAGALVDRFDRRKLLTIVNIARAFLAAVLVVAIMFGLHGLVLLYGIFFAFGLLEILGDHGSFALLPMVSQKLEKANGYLQGAELLAQKFVGPPAGGVLFALSAVFPFGAQVVAYLGAAVGAKTLRFESQSASTLNAPSSLLNEIGDGFRLVWTNVQLRILAIIYGTVQAVYVAGFSILVLFSRDILMLGSTGFSLLLTAGAIGALVAALFAGRLIEFLGPDLSLTATLLSTAIATVTIAAVRMSAVTAAMICTMGFGAVVWKLILVSKRQRIIADQKLLGRVNGVYRMIGLGSMAVGALLGGLLAAKFGLSAPFYIAAPVLVIAALLWSCWNRHGSRSPEGSFPM